MHSITSTNKLASREALLRVRTYALAIHCRVVFPVPAEQSTLANQVLTCTCQHSERYAPYSYPAWPGGAPSASQPVIYKHPLGLQLPIVTILLMLQVSYTQAG